MPVLAVCPNPECGAELVIPRRLGAHVTCDECDIEWVVEDFDPVDLVSLDEEEDWRGGLEDEDEDLDLDLNAPANAAVALLPIAAEDASLPQWECSECGMLYLGSRPPMKCPGCGASGDHYSLVADDLETSLDALAEEEIEEEE